MTEHCFALALAHDPGLENGDAIEALGDAGLTDATIRRTHEGAWLAEVTREATSFSDALVSAIREVRDAGLEVTRVGPDEYMTLSEIAEYLGRSNESIRLLLRGERGDGSFPPPALKLTDRGKLWRRTEVARWADLPPEEQDRADCIAVVNASLQFQLFDNDRDREMFREIIEAMGLSARYEPVQSGDGGPR